MNKPFKFKQFSVKQDQCAMKIGTDGVLLGAWTSVKDNPSSVLDIGTGTGILSLMLAQRCPEAFIEAIEIDDKAFEQCVDNFENSPWSDRLFCYHSSLLEYVAQVDEVYDLIVCNPPFYSDSFKTKQDSRNKARFQDAMPFEHLIYSLDRLLSKQGICSVVIPFSEENRFISLASEANLFPQRILYVKGHPEAKIKRSLIEFTRVQQTFKSAILIIETARHQYTQDYIDLTQYFYVKM